MEEAHNSQRLFFISKELQLNTKFHYMEVTTTSENYKITLCISKIAVKRKSFFTSAYTLSRQKTTREEERVRKREEERGREGKREREEERVRKRMKEGERGREGKGERERRGERRKKKNGESGTKSFFKYTAPFGYVP